MCKKTYRAALSRIGTAEEARRLMYACDALKLELVALANNRPGDLAELACTIANVRTSIAVLAPVVGEGLIDLAECEQLQRLQRVINQPEVA